MTAHTPVGRCGRVECVRCGARQGWPLWAQPCPVQAHASPVETTRKWRARQDPETLRLAAAEHSRRHRRLYAVPLTPQQAEHADRLHAAGHSVGQIAHRVGACWQRVAGYLAEAAE